MTNRKVRVRLESFRGVRAGNGSGPGLIRRAIAISLFHVKVSLLCCYACERNNSSGRDIWRGIGDDVDGCFDQDRCRLLGNLIEVDDLRGRVSNACQSSKTQCSMHGQEGRLFDECNERLW